MNVGNCFPGKFSDTRQGPVLQAGLSKQRRLRPAMLTLFGMKYKWHKHTSEMTDCQSGLKKDSVCIRVIMYMTTYK